MTPTKNTPATNTPTTDAPDDNHMSSVRRMLVDQMRDLRGATTPEALRQETERAKSVALVAQAITGAARVEADYAASTGSSTTVPFLEPQPTEAATPSITYSPGRIVHRMRG